MPGQEHYTGRTDPEALRQFAEHHYEHRTRHISRDEHAMISRIADDYERVLEALRTLRTATQA